MMVEAGCDMVTERDVLAAIDYAHQQIKQQVEVQRNFCRELGIVKREYAAPVKDEDLERLIVERASEKLKASMNGVTDKSLRARLVDEAEAAVIEAINELPADHQ